MEELEQKDKYYIPEISEFYKGFEFEMDQFGLNNFHKTESDHPELVEYWIEENRVRVKYLDEDDIKDLGWGFKFGRSDKERTIFEIVIEKLNSREPKGIKYNLLHTPLTNHVLIYSSQIEFKNLLGFNKVENVEEPQTIFAGAIKNKSELKVLMKQLGICQ